MSREQKELSKRSWAKLEQGLRLHVAGQDVVLTQDEVYELFDYLQQYRDDLFQHRYQTEYHDKLPQDFPNQGPAEEDL